MFKNQRQRRQIIKFKLFMRSSLILLLLIHFLANAAYIQQASLEIEATSDPVIAYRRFIKEKNEKKIRESNDMGKHFTLEAYPFFIKYTLEELSQINSNKQMTNLMVDGVEFKVGGQRRKNQKIFDNLQIDNIVVNNTFETGSAKDQGKCGGCYSFAGNSVVNYATNRYYNPQPNQNILRLASEQQIIECSSLQKNKGCDGGWPHQSMIYIQRNGIQTDQIYKYRNETFLNGVIRPCQVTRQTIKQIRIGRSFTKVSQYNDVEDLISIINRYKVAAIGVYSDDFNFRYYRKGILTECGQGKMNHAVTVVGYTINHDKQEYAWIVKNSWGVRWGNKGHIMISMMDNMCNALNYASYLVTNQV